MGKSTLLLANVVIAFILNTLFLQAQIRSKSVEKLKSLPKSGFDTSVAPKMKTNIVNNVGDEGSSSGGEPTSECLTANAGDNQTISYGGNGVSIGANRYSNLYTYSWTPSTGLSSATIPNPIANPTQTTTYTLTVSPKTNLITNGSFENGNNGVNSDLTFIPDGNLVGVWTGQYYFGNRGWEVFNQWCNNSPAHGNTIMMINGSAHPTTIPRVWYQTINVSPNNTYNFSGQVLNLFNNYNYNNPHIIVTINGDQIYEIQDLGPGCQWTTMNALWQAGPNVHSATIEIFSPPNIPSTQSGNDFAIDNLSFANSTCPTTTSQVTVIVDQPIPIIYANGSQQSTLDWCVQYEYASLTPLTLSTNVTGDLQWYKNGVAIPGANQQTLTQLYEWTYNGPNPRTFVYTVSNYGQMSDPVTVVSKIRSGDGPQFYYDDDNAHYIRALVNVSNPWFFDPNYSYSWSVSAPAELTHLPYTTINGDNHDTYKLGISNVSSYPASFTAYFTGQEFGCSFSYSYTIVLTGLGSYPTFTINSTAKNKPVKITQVTPDKTLTKFSFTISPNPATTTATIVSNKPHEAIQIFTINGQLVKSIKVPQKTSTIIDVSALHSNTYLIKVFSNSTGYTKKLIIAR
jgi:hypothetical protein